jgi:hydroxymethylbilane synthase
MLLKGEAEIAVHSAKDMPSALPEGLQIIAFTKRENASDVLISHKDGIRLENEHIRVGTASTRRVATLARYFPHIITCPVRGNLQTRIRKMEEGACDALLLAFAGVSRMGYSDIIRQIPDLETFTPAVGQGSLAIEASTHLDPAVQRILTQALSDPETRICLEAERAFLRAMEGGCSVPVFGYAQRNGDNLILSGGIISLDGKDEVRMKNSLSWPYEGENSHLETGKKLAAQILDAGGASILSKIKQTLQP